MVQHVQKMMTFILNKAKNSKYKIFKIFWWLSYLHELIFNIWLESTIWWVYKVHNKMLPCLAGKEVSQVVFLKFYNQPT